MPEVYATFSVSTRHLRRARHRLIGLPHVSIEALGNHSKAVWAILFRACGCGRSGESRRQCVKEWSKVVPIMFCW